MFYYSTCKPLAMVKNICWGWGTGNVVQSLNFLVSLPLKAKSKTGFL